MLQIIGIKSSNESRKALRFCKERSIAHQFVDLKERPLSKGEWVKIFSAVEPLSLIDTESSYYKKEGYSFREFDPIEELMLNPQLLKLPLLVRKHKVAVGFDSHFIVQGDT